jgi:uncharacterized RDD family membrane protein YckC
VYVTRADVDAPVHDASLARRAAAALYESMLLAALALLAGFLLAPLVSPQSGAATHSLVVPSAPARALEFGVLFALGAAYCVYGWSRGRRTLPQKTWGLWLADREGKPPSPGRALARYVACWIGPALALAVYVVLRPHGLGAHAAWFALLNWLWAFVDPDRRFLHDRIAGTRVVKP